MITDALIGAFDQGLRALFAPANASRARPDADVEEAELSAAEKQHAAALMRINHVGEICAQALYSGQALTSKNPHITETLQTAAKEEIDHLAWCETRIAELGGRQSLLNPVWYAGSFSIGIAAGLLGDDWNLGFLEETEKQVSEHLTGHLDQLSTKDTKTRTIIEQMQQDEQAHADTAYNLGAKQLPPPVKSGMQLASKIMTTTAYYV